NLPHRGEHTRLNFLGGKAPAVRVFGCGSAVGQVRRNVVPIAPPIFRGVARCEPLAALIEKLAGERTGIAFRRGSTRTNGLADKLLLHLFPYCSLQDGAVSCDESRRCRLGSKEWRIKHREKTPVHQCGCRSLIFAAWI